MHAARAATHQWRLNAHEAANFVLAFDEVWRPCTRLVDLVRGAIGRNPMALKDLEKYFRKTFIWPEIRRRMVWGDLSEKEYREWRDGLDGIDRILREEIERRAVGARGDWS